MRQASKQFNIAGREVGGANPALIVAEVAQAHDGSLGLAHAFIDAVADAGGDAIKFQMHIADAESTRDEPWRTRFSRQDKTRYDYWRRMEFDAEQWQGLRDHAAERNLLFVCSPFSRLAVERMVTIGADVLKIASGEVFDLASLLPDDVRLPTIISTGMSGWRDIDKSVDVARSLDLDFVLLQCTTQYPTPLDKVGLNVIEDMRERYGCPVGLSDHSGTVFPSLATLARGFDMLEVHVTLDRRMFGPDVSSSLTCEELTHLCRARDAFHAMDVAPVDKDASATEFQGLRDIFSKSVSLTRAMEEGEILDRDCLALKKPGTGIPGAELDNLVGRRLRRAVLPDCLLQWSDLE